MENQTLATFSKQTMQGKWVWEIHEELDQEEVVTGMQDGEPQITTTTVYQGRVSSPFTQGQGDNDWEHGTFTADELREYGVQQEGGEEDFEL
ncbi:hypothetical protein HLRTI_000492 [Halorhabdus tiamatea SARL4B]|uniref:Uncharacterized protein n=1 Tax=Halorhabdus tiamatea SARL4B TaxID=1033806 RepID=F7PMJ1_9EURY|nr:hypothetical protein [Halorhabdus tiamatea]ERJ07450.1 hypothetical protein HLRTI_000492 [Halorhabdus tiamatea SARL4B]